MSVTRRGKREKKEGTFMEGKERRGRRVRQFSGHSSWQDVTGRQT